MARKRLGDVLLEDGLIDEDDLKEALDYKEKSGYRLGTALVALRIIADWQLTEALGKSLEMEVVDLNETHPNQAALKCIPVRLAERFDLIPLAIEGRGSQRRLLVAMSDPLNRPVVKRMQDVAGCPVRPVLASLSSIKRAIRRFYQGEPGAAKAPADAPAPDTGERAMEQLDEFREQTRQITLSQLRRELEVIDEQGQADLPPPPVAELSAEPGLAVELKFRALLHLLLKKGVIDGRDYAESLRHMLEAFSDEDGG